jgi:hypothetical protein
MAKAKRAGARPHRPIDAPATELDDWRGETLRAVRKLIHEADPEVVGEWKWQKATSPGVPRLALFKAAVALDTSTAKPTRKRTAT